MPPSAAAPTRAPEAPALPERSGAPLRRELAILAIGLALGLMIAPLVTFLVGSRVLGAYAGGPGLGALMAGYLRGLANGLPAFWAVALGPYAFILVGRALIAGLRRIVSD